MEQTTSKQMSAMIIDAVMTKVSRDMVHLIGYKKPEECSENWLSFVRLLSGVIVGDRMVTSLRKIDKELRSVSSDEATAGVVQAETDLRAMVRDELVELRVVVDALIAEYTEPKQ